jgi:hypothetical protein
MVVSVVAITLAAGLAPPDFESFVNFLFVAAAVLKAVRQIAALAGAATPSRFPGAAKRRCTSMVRHSSRAPMSV